MHSNNQNVVIFLLFVILLGLSLWLIEQGSLLMMIGIFGMLMMLIVIFYASDTTLLILLVLTLALGSSYKWHLAQKSFYIRFLFLSLIALRGCFMFLSAKTGHTVTHWARSTFLHWTMLLVAVLGVLSSFYSLDPLISAQRSVSFLLLYFVIFVYFWMQSKDPEESKEQAMALWKSMLIILGVGFFFLILGVPGMFHNHRLRLIIGNPNQLGHYCAMGASVAAWRFMEAKQKSQKMIAGVAVIGICIAIFWSASRGALIAVTLALFVQFFLCYRARLLVAVGTAVLFGSAHFLIMKNTDPLTVQEDPTFMEATLLRTKTLTTGSGRLDVWKSAWYRIKQKPFFGYGFGIVDEMFYKGFFPEIPLSFQGGHVHNSYVEELVNLGWIGATPIFINILGLITLGIVFLFGVARHTESYRFTCALYGGVLAGTVSGAFESWFTSVGSVFCFPFWLMGMLFVKMIFHFKDWGPSRA